MTLKQTTIIIIFLSLFLKLAGFFRESLIARIFGAGAVTDGYLLIYTILTLVILIVSTGFNQVFLPFYQKAYTGAPGGTDRNARGVLNYSVLFFALLGLVLFLLSSMGTALFGELSATAKTVLHIGRFYALFLFLFALNAMLDSYLQAKGSFIPTHLSKVFATLMSALFGWFFGSRLGIISFAYGFGAGVLVGTIVQLTFLKKRGFAFGRELRIEKSFYQPFLILLIPSLLNAVVSPINTVVDKLFATAGPAGAVTYLSNAALLVSIPATVYITTVGSVIFSLLTRAIGRKNDFFRILSDGLQLTLIIFVPLALGLILLSRDIISFIYQHGAFHAIDTERTRWVLLMYGPLIITQGLQEVLSKTLYTLDRAKSLLKLTVTTLFLNIVFNLIFYQLMGYPGLALSSSLVSLYYLAMTGRLLRAHIPAGSLTDFKKNTVRLIPPALIMTAGVYGAYQIPFISALSPLVRLMLLTAFGAALYAGSTYLLNRQGLSLLLKYLKER